MAAFAAVVSGVVGTYNLLSGIAAVGEDDRIEHVGKVLFGINISGGVGSGWSSAPCNCASSFLIAQRSPVGHVLGISIAAISATLTVFLIFVYPLWAILVTTVDLFIIYGLTVSGDEFV